MRSSTHKYTDALSRFFVENAAVRIKGVYPYMFQFEECNFEGVRTNSLKYTDMLIGKVKISKLN